MKAPADAVHVSTDEPSNAQPTSKNCAVNCASGPQKTRTCRHETTGISILVLRHDGRENNLAMNCTSGTSNCLGHCLHNNGHIHNMSRNCIYRFLHVWATVRTITGKNTTLKKNSKHSLHCAFLSLLPNRDL